MLQTPVHRSRCDIYDVCIKCGDVKDEVTAEHLLLLHKVFRSGIGVLGATFCETTWRSPDAARGPQTRFPRSEPGAPSSA